MVAARFSRRIRRPEAMRPGLPSGWWAPGLVHLWASSAVHAQDDVAEEVGVVGVLPAQLQPECACRYVRDPEQGLVGGGGMAIREIRSDDLRASSILDRLPVASIPAVVAPFECEITHTELIEVAEKTKEAL